MNRMAVLRREVCRTPQDGARDTPTGEPMGIQERHHGAAVTRVEQATLTAGGGHLRKTRGQTRHAVRNQRQRMAARQINR